MRVICRRCERDMAHYARGLCVTCYGKLRRLGRVVEYPKLRLDRHDPAKCPTCEEVRSMRDWATGEQIAAALGKTAEAIDTHLRRHAPELREVMTNARNAESRHRYYVKHHIKEKSA